MIRALDPAGDRAAVSALLTEAQDYYHLWKGRAPGLEEVDDFFTGAPLPSDSAATLRLGLFVGDRLIGLAEVFFGFPTASDAYLGLMILAPDTRSNGHGARFLAQIEDRCRAAQATSLYLAVLQANPRGAAFWARMGFVPTGISRDDTEYGHTLHRLVKPL
ncbi:GNAT family N-acetyltransferase [Pseudotabrizicola alkalilacus]|uniref:GNAT family N-acetyltransferase n=1 Tax=Pseudotabrizicola alkalilacus TaxID=2305252 RepID=A0A411Z796_9RHOB|nr:GNAT family N-acetyltransferase [Pseudotabrizicola alkalilacus]RGP38941.1 GNAT family N-acetyltransferase [Pseudotabrizicola alkalilacus]